VFIGDKELFVFKGEQSDSREFESAMSFVKTLQKTYQGYKVTQIKAPFPTNFVELLKKLEN